MRGSMPRRRKLYYISDSDTTRKSAKINHISSNGHRSVNHAKAVFKKRFGMTMREYRAHNAGSITALMKYS